MKTNLLMAALVMATAFSAQAQAQSDAKPATLQTNVAKIRRASTFKLIPTLGYSAGLAATSGDSKGVNSTAEAGSNGGVLVEMTMGKGWVSWQSGLLYMREGVQLNYNDWDSWTLNGDMYSSKVSGQLDYLGIPLLVKVNFPPRPRSARFAMKSGLIPAFLTSSKVRFDSERTVNGVRVKSSDESSSQEGVRSVNVMGLFGVGGEFPIGDTMDIRIEGQYSRGLLPISREYGPMNLYTQSFMFNVGMGFDL